MNKISLAFIRLNHIYEVFQLRIILKLFISLFILWLLGSGFIYLVEGRYYDTFKGESEVRAEYFSTYDQSMWGILVYLFSGFESYIPYTLAGRIGAVVFMVFGVGIIGLFTANIASILIEKSEKKGMIEEKPGLVKFRNHLIICGWSQTTINVLEYISRSAKYSNIPILIIDDREEVFLPDRRNTPRYLYYLRGDFTKKEILEASDIEYAKHVIMIAGDRNEHTANKLLLACYTVKSISNDLFVSVYINKSSKISLLSRYADEIISVPHVQSRIVAQTAITRGIMKVLSDLLDTSQDTSMIRLCKTQPDIVGFGYREARIYVLEKLGGILIGIYDNATNSYIINPRSKDSKLKISESHTLIIL